MAMYGGGGFGDQFAGGGFMPTQTDQGGAGSGGSKGGRNKDQTLRAVTIRQLVMAAAKCQHEQDLVIDGVDLSNVTVVGKVVDISEHGTNIEMRVSDGTGVVDVTNYVVNDTDPQATAQKLAEWRPGTYVRVYGHMGQFGENWRINAFAVRVVHDFNEITYHNLQAIFQHLHLAKGGGTGTMMPGAGMPPQQGNFGGGGYSGPAAGGWQQQQEQPGGFQGGGGGPMNGGPGGMDPCPAAILQIVSDPNAGDQGVHINDICSRLAHQGFNRQQVEAGLQFLQNEAHAYTTCDDNHWKATT